MSGNRRGGRPGAENPLYLLPAALIATLYDEPYTGGVHLWGIARGLEGTALIIMTLGQHLNQFNQRPAKTLRPWQRKVRILARKTAHQGEAQSVSVLARRVWSALLMLLVVALLVLASPISRHWLSTSFANIAIVGGITAAPIISLVAWIGVALPVHAPLHQAAPTLFIGALLWMAMAFVSAHARRDKATDH